MIFLHVRKLKFAVAAGELKLVCGYFVAFLANAINVYALPIWLEFGCS
jgi:hypothetical protein